MASGLFTVRNATRNRVIASKVRLAGSSRERRNGFLSRHSLDPDEGLWITPCEAIHTFGMKIAIDIAFIDRSRFVRQIRHSLSPGRVAFCLRACSVLELAPGAVSRSGTQLGDLIEIGECQGGDR